MASLLPTARANDRLIDDFSRPDGRSALGTAWRAVSDRVMGGVSSGTIARRELDGRRALCLSGQVSLENNGGFVQALVDLSGADTPGDPLDASAFTGVRLLVRGNGEVYNLHLKTTATILPWQSYRASFVAEPEWRAVQLSFASFEPHRLVQRLDPRQLTKLSILGIGRAFAAEVRVAEIALYR